MIFFYAGEAGLTSQSRSTLSPASWERSATPGKTSLRESARAIRRQLLELEITLSEYTNLRIVSAVEIRYFKSAELFTAPTS